MNHFKKIGYVAAFAVLAPTILHAATPDQREYYPTLTPADVAVCRPEFTALKADIVRHFRASAAEYQPGGKEYQKHPGADFVTQNAQANTRWANEENAKDASDFYINGEMFSGEGILGVNDINKYANAETVTIYETTLKSDDGDPNAPVYPSDHWIDYTKTRADKCVARVFLDRFHAMHAETRVAEARGAGDASANQTRQVMPGAVRLAAEAHNPANEGGDCIQPIGKKDFAALHVSSNMGGVLRNKCAWSVEVTWCIEGGDCSPGFSNLGTVPAMSDRSISVDPTKPARILYAACRNGFVRGQGELSRTLQHACK